MNKFLRPLFATLVLALTFGACTKEDLSLPTVRGGEGNHVQFSLNTGSLRAQGDETITRPTPALDREKKINELYAVVFKAGSGVFYKTIKCDLISGEDYKFDSERPGQYYFFLVANPDAGLLQKMQAGPNTKEELGKLIAEQTPGDDNTAASFLMTSELTTVTTKAAETVSVTTPIKLERVAARFDFYNRVEDFVITKITFKKRYTTTHLFPQVKKMDELTSTEDMVYAPTDGAAGVTATIYGYENDTRGDTYFTLEGTYKGKEIKPQEVRLESMVVKRNHLYNIYLHTPATGGNTDPSDPSQEFGKLPYLITVLDWNQGQELTMSDDNLLKPLYVDFTAHLENAGYMDPYLVNSPKTIYSTTKEATKIILTLGNYMQAGTIELADPAAAAGVTLEEVPGSEEKDAVTGKITKKYKLSLPARNRYDNSSIEIASGSATAKPHSFQEVKLVAYNALKNESVEFTVKHGRPKMAPEYLTEYNLAPVSGYDQSKALTDDQIANLAFATSHNNDKSGYFNPFHSVQQLKELTIGGKQYRMAKDGWDWANFIPSSQVRGNSKFFFVGKTAQDVKGTREVIRYLPWSKALSPRSFYLDTKADYKTSADKLTTYALRFKNDKKFGNLEQVAVKYEWVDSSSADQKTLLTPTADANTTALKVTFRYLGENWNGEVESIANDDFWSKDNASDVSRIFPLVGYQQQSSFRNRGVLGRYISVATQDEYKDDATMPFYISYAKMADVNYVDGTTTDYSSGGWWVTKATNAVDGLTLFYPIRLFENE